MTGPVQTDLPIWLVLTGLILAIFLSWFSYSGSRARMLFRKPVRYGLMMLRAAAILLVFWLFAGIYLQSSIQTEQKPVFILAVDNSSSMVPDPESGDLAIAIGDLVEDMELAADGQFQFSIWSFGEELRPFTEPDFTDRITRFDQFAEILGGLYHPSAVAGMLMLTDGIANAGDPLPASMEQLAFAVSFMATGDTVQGADLFIDRIEGPETVYLDNRFDLQVYYGHHQVSDGACRLRIWNADNRLVKDTLLGLDEAEPAALLPVTLEADSLGVRTWTVEIEKLAEERNVYNNRKTFHTRVIEEKSRIRLLYNTPHPDIRVFREVCDGLANFELITQKVPDDMTMDAEADLIIAYQLPGKSGAGVSLIREYLDSGISLLYMIGPSTGLDELNRLQQAVVFKEGSDGLTEDYRGVFTQSFNLFALPDGFGPYLDILPPLKGPVASIDLKSRISVLMKQKIKSISLEDPLLWFATDDGRKSGFWLGEGLWRWYQYEYLNYSDHFFTRDLLQSVLNYLLINDLDQRLQVTVQDVLSSFETIRWDVRLYDASYELTTRQELQIQITDPEGSRRESSLRKLDDSYWFELNPRDPGSYSYRIWDEVEPDLLSYEGVVEVVDIPFERLDSRARHAEMRQVAEQKGGQFFTFDQKNEWLDYFDRMDPGIRLIKESSGWISLISLKWLLFLLAGLFGLEWAIRRYLGTR